MAPPSVSHALLKGMGSLNCPQLHADFFSSWNDLLRPSCVPTWACSCRTFKGHTLTCHRASYDSSLLLGTSTLPFFSPFQLSLTHFTSRQSALRAPSQVSLSLPAFPASLQGSSLAASASKRQTSGFPVSLGHQGEVCVCVFVTSLVSRDQPTVCSSLSQRLVSWRLLLPSLSSCPLGWSPEATYPRPEVQVCPLTREAELCSPGWDGGWLEWARRLEG